MAETVNIEISKDLIKPIIENKIRLAIIEAFGNTQGVMDSFVNNIINDRVAENGMKSNYSSENKYSWIDIVVRKSIQEAVRVATVEFIQNNTAVIQKHVEKILKSEKGTNSFAAALLASVNENIKYGFKMNIDFVKKENH